MNRRLWIAGGIAGAVALGAVVHFADQPAPQSPPVTSAPAKVAPPTATVAPPSSVPTSSAYSPQAELTRLEACSRTSSCGFKETDPRNAELETGRRIAAELRRLAESVTPGAATNAAAGEFARRYVEHPDGHVQEAALQIMSRMEPDPRNLDVTLRALKSTHDAGIFQQAMQEFQRYPDAAARRQIDEVLMTTLKTGGHYAGQQVAMDLLPLLSPANVARYQAVLAELPADSGKAKYLSRTLEEYQRRQSGG